MIIDNELRKTLQYCLDNLKHPEITTGFQLQHTYMDGYYTPPLKTSEQILQEAERNLESAKARAEKIKQFEICIQTLKYFLI